MLRFAAQLDELLVREVSEKLSALPVALVCAIALAASIEAKGASRLVTDRAGASVSSSRTDTPSRPMFTTWIERRDRGVVKQSLDYSCGIAALATLLQLSFDIEASESSLLELLASRAKEWELAADWKERGVSLAILRKVANHYGVHAMGVVVSPAVFMKLQEPAIAFIDYRGSPHFTVIKPPLTDGRIDLADPSWGNRILTRWQFMPMFLNGGRGTLLLLSKS
ncbi:MAG: cysteine peptidase family C39 domain-containing protein [Halioglobus sp.]